MELTASVIYGSVRSERQGIKAARYLQKELKKRITQVHFIDPEEFELPLLDKMYKEYAKGKAPENMKQVGERLLNSDGFLIVTGEYNHSIPPVLKNILDHYQAEYFFKPSAIASYSSGSFGGVRSAVQLRIVLAELGMPSISSSLPFPKVQDNFDSKGTPKAKNISKRTNRFLDEFIWYMEALKEKRKNGTPF